MHISITHDVIDTARMTDAMKAGADGAVCVFDGIVRNNTHGRQTLFLDYEAYEAMAIQQMEGLATEAMTKFGVRDVALVHRLGRLQVGETSVLIVVASAHRGAAFDACRCTSATSRTPNFAIASAANPSICCSAITSYAS